MKLFRPFKCENLIRLGKDNDGGYLVNPTDICKSSKLLSFGIGSDASFEQQFTELNDCLVEAYDLNAEKHEFFNDDKHTLHLSNIGTKWGQISVDNMLIEDNTFIKCDIEGGEYKILNDLIALSHKLSGLVIEFHSVNVASNYNELLNFISKVDLKLVHIHVNNYFYYKADTGNIPDILELSFTSDKNVKYDANLQLPHNLDMPNNPDDQDFKIMF